MPPLPFHDFPELTRQDLLDLGQSARALRLARELFQEGRVNTVSWEKPVLTGTVSEADGKAYAPVLNLRSLAMPQNRCTCETGRRGLVCIHALALCLQVEQEQESALTQAIEATTAPSKTDRPAKPTGQVGTKDKRQTTKDPQKTQNGLTSLQVKSGGKPLGAWLLLPPNIETAIQRQAIPLKLELEAEGRRVAPEKLYRGQAYAVHPGLAGILAELERMGGGKLYGLLQVQPAILHAMLLAILEVPEVTVAWVNQPQRPIADLPKKLVGWFAKPAMTGSEETEPPPVQVRRSRGVLEKERPPAKSRPQPPRSARSLAESDSAWGASTSLRITCDGSEHFLSFAFSRTSDPEAVRWLDILKLNGFKKEVSNGRYWLRDRFRSLNFLAEHWEALKESEAVQFTRNFQQRTSHLKVAEVAIETEAYSGGFDVSVRLGVGNLSAADIQKALNTRHHYSQEGNTIWLLPPAQVEQVTRLQQQLTGQQDRVLTPNFKTRLRTAQLALAEDFLEEMDPGFQPPEAWRRRSGALREISRLEPLPTQPGLDAMLRGYQRTGASWLWHLYRHQLGGILADEMGLGKTVQALALIRAAVGAGVERTPALVVCPASLVENWRREAARFTPDLRVFKHHGTQRIDSPEAAEAYDLIVTSYGTLVRDNALFQAIPFRLALADEAQHVKNRRTQAARALRGLQADGRFVLTGTPIENAVADLRSLFAFLMPGYLTAVPQGASREEMQWFDERHLQQAAPYILRRTKDTVAPELPEKIKQTLYCEMPAAQQRFYQKVREDTEKQIFEMEMAGASEGKIKFAALTQLLRLRQACADPRILDEEFDPRHSAKLIAFREILEEAIDGNHRILLFSQFTRVLGLLKQFLESEGHPFCYLDGSTRNRQDVCDRFNNDANIPVFLISLKAGGVGLNLTGADTVVHFDPWWNPAVEAQATDRAHRIGQSKTVTSLKLIAAGTVEEKVMEIQASKTDLLKNLFEAAGASTAKVSLDEIKALVAG